MGRRAVVVLLLLALSALAPLCWAIPLSGRANGYMEASTPRADPSLPGVGVFFYPWYGHWRHWEGPSGEYSPPYSWASHYLPDLLRGVFMPSVELYDSSDSRVILWQLYEMRRAHVSYAIVSWWGPGSYEDRVFNELMIWSSSAVSPHPRLKWCILYEEEGYDDPPVESIVEDLKYVLERYAPRHNYLRVDGMPVVLVYADEGDGPDYVRRWCEAKERLGGNVFIVLKVFPGYREYAGCVDSWYQYAPALRFELQEPYSGFVSPGLWRAGDQSPLLERDPQAFRHALLRLLESGVGIKTVQTWNEWHEGTQVEPGQEVDTTSTPYLPLQGYGEEFVDIMREVIPSIYAYDPELDVEPQIIGGDTGHVEVSGRGFPPRSTIELFLDSHERLGTIVADVKGHFKVRLRLGEVKPGLHALIAKGGNESTAVYLIYKKASQNIAGQQQSITKENPSTATPAINMTRTTSHPRRGDANALGLLAPTVLLAILALLLLTRTRRSRT